MINALTKSVEGKENRTKTDHRMPESLMHDVNYVSESIPRNLRIGFFETPEEKA